MDTLGLQEFMAGANTVSQPFDNIIEKFQQHQLHHHSHNHHHHPPHQALSHHHHPHQQQQQQQQHQQQQQPPQQQPQQSNQSNLSQSQNNLFSLFDFPYSPESSKLAYNSGSNLDGGMGTSNLNDCELSSLSNENVNSDDGLNISAEGGSISFMRDGSKGSKKSLDKGSDEYKKRRARNNVAVRKSREKAKQRSKETEKKVSELQNENDTLKRSVVDLNGKVMILKRLLEDVGVDENYVESQLTRPFTDRSKGGGSGGEY